MADLQESSVVVIRQQMSVQMPIIDEILSLASSAVSLPSRKNIAINA